MVVVGRFLVTDRRYRPLVPWMLNPLLVISFDPNPLRLLKGPRRMSIISESISHNMGRRRTLVALLAVLGVLFLARADAKCFHIDGSATDDTFQPCDADASASGCCASNKGRPDICLTSGLCFAQEFGFEGLIFSNGCTDKSGNAKGCPTVCPQGMESNPNRLYCPARRPSQIA